MCQSLFSYPSKLWTHLGFFVVILIINSIDGLLHLAQHEVAVTVVSLIMIRIHSFMSLIDPNSRAAFP